MSIEARIAAVKQALEDYKKSFVPPAITWDEFWEPYKAIIPQIASGENFTYENECDVEFTPFYDDDIEKWRLFAYSFDLERNDDDGLCILIYYFDGDCSWEPFEQITVEDDFSDAYNRFFNTDDYFIGWTEYHLWCAENGGVDPLKEFFHSATTVENHLSAAEDTIRVLSKP
jgi:hypothetical protein